MALLDSPIVERDRRQIVEVAPKLPGLGLDISRLEQLVEVEVDEELRGDALVFGRTSRPIRSVRTPSRARRPEITESERSGGLGESDDRPSESGVVDRQQQFERLAPPIGVDGDFGDLDPLFGATLDGDLMGSLVCQS